MTLIDIKDAIGQLKINHLVLYDNLAYLLYCRTVNDSMVFESRATKAHANTPS